MGRRYEEREGEPATLGALPGSALLGALPGAAFLLTVAGDIREWNDRAEPLVTDRDLTAFDGLARPDHRERVRDAVATAATGTEPTVAFDLSAGGEPVAFDCRPVTVEGEVAAVLATRRPEPPRTGTAADTDTEAGGADVGPLRRVELLEAVGDGAYALDGDRRFVAVTDRLAATLDRSREALVGEPLRSVLAGDSGAAAVGLHEAVLAGDRSTGVVEVTLEGAADELPVELHVATVPDGDDAGVVGIVRDVSGRHRREQQLARHRDQLATLNRISEAVEGVVQGIVESATREGIEATVCERLAASDLYRTVWVGRSGAGGLEPTATAGAPATLPAEGSPTEGDGDAADDHPAVVAFRTGDSCVRRSGWMTADADGEADRAAEHGIRATMALPVTHRETTYGVLCLHSPRADAFTDREQAALERLARVVGFAINAADTELLLHSSTTTELVFRIDDDRCFLARLSRTTGPVTLRWTVPEDGGLRHYLEVEGAAADVMAAATAAGADDVAVVSEHEGEGGGEPTTVLEARLATSVAGRLSDAGAVVQAATAADGIAEFAARIAGRTDTRTIVETFQDEFGASLKAKRRVDEPVETARDLRQATDERLTDRQGDVLRTAYLMGYYEWPRDHTAEEVADRMDITSATLHYHLRAAQRNFLELFFDEAPAGE